MEKAYETYKESKLQWVNKIPYHWIEGKVKYLFDIGRGRVISQQELNPNGLYPVYSSQTKNNGCLGYIDTYDFDDDILTWTTDGVNAGEVFKRNGKFNCTNVCGTLKPKKDLNLDYFLYLMKFLTPFYKRPDTNGAKIMNGEMAEIISYLPPKHEQTQIASYLDYHTQLIDDLIAKKETLIEKLQEQRQAIINEAVTKGLKKDVKLKDSGIEWLGKIPEHWEVVKLFHLSENIGSGTTPKSDKREYYDGNIGWLNTGDLNDGFVKTASKKITEKALEDYSVLKIYPANSVVIALYGATIGKLAIIGDEMTTNQACCVLNPNDKLNYKFLFYLLMASRPYLLSLSYGGGQPNISQEIIKQLRVSLPQTKEQEHIVETLEKRLYSIDDSTEKINISIQKLKEYRQSLISEAVTGKIDVRDWQASKS